MDLRQKKLYSQFARERQKENESRKLGLLRTAAYTSIQKYDKKKPKNTQDADVIIIIQFRYPTSHLYSRFNSSTSSSNKFFLILPRIRLDLNQILLGRRRRSCQLIIIAVVATAVSSESLIQDQNQVFKFTIYLDKSKVGPTFTTRPF